MVAKLRMACTKGNTNRECSFFGVGWWGLWDGNEQKVAGQFFFGGADFFSAKRLFFRVARDVSGERSAPPWARVEIKLKMRFQTLSHSPSHDRAKALTSPPPDFLFSSIHQKPTKAHKTLHPSKPHPTKAHHTTINQNEFVKWGQSQRIFSPFFYTFVTPFVCIFTELFILLSHKMPNEVRPLI